MKCILILCGYLIVSISCIIEECKLFDDDHHGFGCWLKDIKIEAEENEINLIAKHDGRNDSDITWFQIIDSMLLNLPKNVFLKFVNLEKIFIENCTGFKNFDKAYFDTEIKYIHFTETDIEYVGDKVFVGLKSIDKLYLHSNKIRTLHKNAFKDLENLNEISLNHNLIEHLDDDIFIGNLNLVFIILDNNRIKTINAKLFLRNINLENIEIANNSISNIEENFFERLEYLKILDLSNNICINDVITGDVYISWLKIQHNFSDCIQNFIIKKELELFSTNSQVLTKQIQELRLKTESNLFYYLIILFVIILISIAYYLFHKRIQRYAFGFESNQFTNLSNQ